MEVVGEMESVGERRKALLERAEQAGLHVAIYGPGDGVVRYRFFRRFLPETPSYFEAGALGTALGLREAEAWLDGFVAARGTM